MNEGIGCIFLLTLSGSLWILPASTPVLAQSQTLLSVISHSVLLKPITSDN